MVYRTGCDLTSCPANICGNHLLTLSWIIPSLIILTKTVDIKSPLSSHFRTQVLTKWLYISGSKISAIYL